MKTKKKYSFSKVIIVQFAIYTFIVLGGYILINIFVNWRLNNSFLVLEDFLKYEDKLKYEDYGGIPMAKFPGCDFAVYDNNNELIYSTDINIDISGDDLIFINDYSNTYYYNIFNYKEKNKNKIIKIYKTTYDDEYDEIVVGSAKLDEDLNVLEGDLFSGAKNLTEKEIDLLNGYYNDEQMIEKYSFNTVYDYDVPDGSNRTLLFMSPMFNSEAYDKAVVDAQRIWFIAIPFLLILILIETYFFNKKIKSSLNELNKVINSYGENGLKNDYHLPKEFESVVDSFESLMKKLKNVEKEKLKIYEDKQKVVANLSHDLKTPLTVVRGYSKAFLDGVVPKLKEKQYLETIYKKSIVATDAIDSLFMYAKFNHPEYSLNMENVDIVEFTKNYLAEKYSEIENNKMQLDIDIKIDKLNVNIDTKAFRRIYENLINNSIKYNKKGTTIYFKMWKSKDLFISVGDNGIGIDKNIKDNIFEVFVTSNSARTSGNGTGLGLSIVKSLVEMHGGEIILVDKPKNGMKTEFLIKIKI